MSATIATKDLKFVIFGSGHDYTRLDSGEGATQIFSHPFVPLNSVNYAGQYLFYVPDENGDAIDAVKDDIAHCTFTPALNTTFDTVGETTVKVEYHREYVNGEGTVIVDKTVEQTITVVDHGTISSSENYSDLYTDGYLFYRPRYTGYVEDDITYVGNGSPKKLSSIPWRAKAIGKSNWAFASGSNLTDISELAFADTSEVTEIYKLFYLTGNLDLSAISGWNVSNVSNFKMLFTFTSINDLSPLSGWNTSNAVSFYHIFEEMSSLTSLHGLENWNVSSVTDFRNAFYHTGITNVDALINWNISDNANLERMFSKCYDLLNLDGLANWTFKPSSIYEMFEDSSSLQSIAGIGNLDVSELTYFNLVFKGCTRLKSFVGLENWDVSSAVSFEQTFNGCHWVDDFSPLADWDMSNVTSTNKMFQYCDFVLDISSISDWDVSSDSDMAGMFNANNAYWSTLLGKKLYADAYYYYDYAGNEYTYPNVQDVDHPLSQYAKDASGASGWTPAVGTSAFSPNWSNIPSWN